MPDVREGTKDVVLARGEARAPLGLGAIEALTPGRVGATLAGCGGLGGSSTATIPCIDSHRMASSVSDRARDALVPNLLSFARIPLAGLLWVAPFTPAWTLSVLVLAGVTDVLDGWLVRRARRRRVHEGDPGALAAHAAQGAFIDGMADKVFVVSAVALVAWTVEAPVWVFLALAVREILFLPLLVAYRAAPEHLQSRVDFTAGVPGKAATVAQFVALVLGLLQRPAFVPAALFAGTVGALATAYYVVRAVRAVGTAAE